MFLSSESQLSRRLQLASWQGSAWVRELRLTDAFAMESCNGRLPLCAHVDLLRVAIYCDLADAIKLQHKKYVCPVALACGR
jgi:hypothetical protein